MWTRLAYSGTQVALIPESWLSEGTAQAMKQHAAMIVLPRPGKRLN